MTASLEPWISESEKMRGVRGVVLRGKALLKQSEKILKKATDYRPSKKLWLQCYNHLSTKPFQTAARINAHSKTNKQNSSFYNMLHHKSWECGKYFFAYALGSKNNFRYLFVSMRLKIPQRSLIFPPLALECQEEREE